MKFLSDFHNSDDFDRCINSSFLTLIPKCSNPSNLYEYRPISLVGCVYKILSKVLVNRLRLVVDEVVGANQFAFVKGRQILYCSLVANGVIDGIRRNGSSDLLLKVDFEKAYDSVDWFFLDFVLEKMRFRKKMEEVDPSLCLNDVSFNIGEWSSNETV